MSNLLVSDITDKFQLTESFVETLLKKNEFSSDVYGLDYSGFMNHLNPLQQMYINFALSTYNRGEEVYQLISPYFGNYTQKRYLDVGCGYGGFLKAFHQKGFETVGVEINRMLYEYSLLNCSQLANCTVVNDDFFNTTSALGTFSCITCNDVIEHVENPVKAIDKMCGILQPEGVLMMEIPNRNAINFVGCDGHYHLFGITTLNRFEAAEYYRQVNSLPDTRGYYEMMGEYYSMEHYVNALKNNGMKVHVIEKHSIGNIEDFPALLNNLVTAYANWKNTDAAKFSYMMQELIDIKFNSYLAELTADYAAYLRTRDRESFYRKYFLSFWSLIAVKG